MMFPILILCFFLSGMTALIYQIAWARYLALFLGHTSYAVVAVLVAFMGGLALGNAWFGGRADRMRKPLRAYAWLEIGIGLYAFAFPAYYAVCEKIFLGLARWMEPGSELLLLKFAFSLFTILLPTVLMGATLPVLTRFLTRSLRELLSKVSALYAINSTGAVVGCLVADFWWIPSFGLYWTLFTAAAVNVGVGLAAWILSAVQERDWQRSVPLAEAHAPEPSELPALERWELRWAVAGIGISGFVAMLYEVAWTRLLALALGSSTHAFSLMLITFISGIAAGAWLVYRWSDIRKPLEAFAWAEAALAVTLFASLFLYERLPYEFARLASLLRRTEAAYPAYEFLQVLICAGVMFIPALCLGMTLPWVSRIATVELARTGRSVGKVFAVNTVGTVLGAAATGFWLLPNLGLAQTFGLGIVLNLAVGGLILVRKRVLRFPWISATVVGATAVLTVLWVGWHFGERWQKAFSFGLWRWSEIPETFDQFRKWTETRDIVFHRDGAGSTVTVVKWTGEDGKETLALRVNGKPDASTLGDTPTQLLIGHIPMVLKEDARDVLVVGFGSGMTCGAVARHPGVERVDVVEISPEVIEAARHFAPFNGDILKDERVRVHLEDAKSLLKISPQEYDVIVSEPSNPWMAGVAGVFTREYYEICRSRLRQGGLMVQWVQVYEMSREAMDTVFATFTSVFPVLNVWQGTRGDLILIGALEPFDPELSAVLTRLKEPAVKDDLARVGLARAPAFLLSEVVSQDNGRYIVPPNTRIHSDLRPILEYQAQEAFFVRQTVDHWEEFDERYSPRALLLLAEYLERFELSEEDFVALVNSEPDERSLPTRLYLSILGRWHAADPHSTEPLKRLHEVAQLGWSSELGVHRLDPWKDLLLDRAEEFPALLRDYARWNLDAYRFRKSVLYLPPAEPIEELLYKLIEADESNRNLYFLYLAELAWARADDTTFFLLGRMALELDEGGDLESTFDLDPLAPHRVLTAMAESLWREGAFEEARQVCRLAVKRRYAGPEAELEWPLLDMVCRKVFASTPPDPGVRTESVAELVPR